MAESIGSKIDKLTREFDKSSTATTAAVNDLSEKVDKLYAAVYGNGKPGYAQRIALLERMADEEARKRSRRNALMAGSISSLVASIVTVLLTAALV